MFSTEETRSNCPECGDTRGRLYTRAIDGGQLQYCHNCSSRSFIRDNERTPKQTVAFVQQFLSDKGDITNTVRNIKLPFDFSHIIPIPAMLWLSKYGLSTHEIKLFGFGWSESYQRLIMPVYDNEKLMYWQGRTFKKVTKENPKYLNIRQSGAKNVFFRRKFHSNNTTLTPNYHPNNNVAIVEDILSAIKVGRYCNTIALLGSYLPSSLYTLLVPYARVYMWLDQDKLTSAVKYATSINAIMGKLVKVVNTIKDPKELSDAEIHAQLS